MDELTARVEALEIQLQAQREEAEVLKTLWTYCRTIDLGQHAAWVACFTADGVFEVRSSVAGFPAVRLRGHTELSGWVANHTKPPAVYHKHLYLMPHIQLNGGTAMATAYFVHLVDIGGTAVIQSYGRYSDTLTKQADYTWRIAERVADVEASPGAQR